MEVLMPTLFLNDDENVYLQPSDSVYADLPVKTNGTVSVTRVGAVLGELLRAGAITNQFTTQNLRTNIMRSTGLLPTSAQAKDYIEGTLTQGLEIQDGDVVRVTFINRLPKYSAMYYNNVAISSNKRLDRVYPSVIYKSVVSSRAVKIYHGCPTFALRLSTGDYVPTNTFPCTIEDTVLAMGHLLTAKINLSNNGVLGTNILGVWGNFYVPKQFSGLALSVYNSGNSCVLTKTVSFTTDDYKDGLTCVYVATPLGNGLPLGLYRVEFEFLGGAGYSATVKTLNFKTAGLKQCCNIGNNLYIDGITTKIPMVGFIVDL